MQETLEYQKDSGRNGPGRIFPSAAEMRCLGMTVAVRIRKSLPTKTRTLIFVFRDLGGPPRAIAHER